MLKIRLKPLGAKKKKIYKISVMKNLSKRDGKSIIFLGYYNPKDKILNFNEKKLLFYLKNGAKLTNTIRHILLKHYLNN